MDEFGGSVKNRAMVYNSSRAGRRFIGWRVYERDDIQDGGLEFAEGTGFSFEIPGGLKSVPVGSLLVVASASAGTAVPGLRIDGFSRIRSVSDPEDAQRVLFVAERLPQGFKVTVR